MLNFLQWTSLWILFTSKCHSFCIFKHSRAPKRSWKIFQWGSWKVLEKSWIFLSVNEWEPCRLVPWLVEYETSCAVLSKLEMGKNTNPARMNRTGSQVLSRTEPESKKLCKTTNWTETCYIKNWTEPKPKCHGSYYVLSLNEVVRTFTRFTVNEEFYFTLL